MTTWILLSVFCAAAAASESVGVKWMLRTVALSPVISNELESDESAIVPALAGCAPFTR